MKHLRNVPWPQLAIEATAIVLSILLAFWIDAWWEARQDRETEREYLAAILSDIDTVLDEADRTIRENEALNSSASGRIAKLRREGLTDEAAILDTLTQTNVSYRLRASLDTYTDLLSSGSILTLRDTQVRNALAKLRATMDFEHEVFRWVVEFGHGISPLLHESINANEPNRVIRLEEQVVIIRLNHIARKSEVRAVALETKEAVVAALENL